MNSNTPKFHLGDIVVIKSYPEKNPLTGDPLHIPPMMVVTGIEIENKKKKTHSNDTGKRIAERIKYHLTWFDNKRSEFVEKVMYESMLKIKETIIPDDLIERAEKENYEQLFNFNYGECTEFSTTHLELEKQKETKSTICTKKLVVKGEHADNIDRESKNSDNVEKTTTVALVTFACPKLVITGFRSVSDNIKYDDFGKLKSRFSNELIKVMWFNPIQQKYSEKELPKECLRQVVNI